MLPGFHLDISFLGNFAVKKSKRDQLRGLARGMMQLIQASGMLLLRPIILKGASGRREGL